MTSYRRGFKGQVWDRHWHWHVQCDAYPTINCVIQKERPSEDELCERCQLLSDDPMERPIRKGK